MMDTRRLDSAVEGGHSASGGPLVQGQGAVSWPVYLVIAMVLSGSVGAFYACDPASSGRLGDRTEAAPSAAVEGRKSQGGRAVSDSGEVQARLPQKVLEQLKAIDADALRIWREQHALGSRTRPGENASLIERLAFRNYLGEKARLFIEFQRLRAAMADAALRSDAGRSRARLFRSESSMYCEGQRRVDPVTGASSFVVQEIYAQEREIGFDAPVDRRLIGEIIDGRGGAAPDRIAFSVRATGGGEQRIVRRRDGTTIFSGTALSANVYDVTSDGKPDGRLLVSTAAAAENRRCSVTLYDYPTEFTGTPGQIRFNLMVADEGEAVSGHDPRLAYEVVDLSGKVKSAVGPEGLHFGRCSRKDGIEWSGVRDSMLIPDAKTRSGWVCSVDVTELDRAQNGVVILRAELPYPNCPLLEETLPPSSGRGQAPVDVDRR